MIPSMENILSSSLALSYPLGYNPDPTTSMIQKLGFVRTSLEVQWLRICASIAGGTGSIPGQGTKIPRAARRGQKRERRHK